MQSSRTCRPPCTWERSDRRGTVIGQLPGDEAADTWGLVLQKDNALVSCVNQALATLTESGELEQITDEWMTEYNKAPVLG